MNPVYVSQKSTDRVWTRREPTLIVVRRTLAEPNAALAGVILMVSFERLRASMTAFNEDRAPSCPFDRLDLSTMVGTRVSCKGVQAARKNPDRNWRPYCCRLLRADAPIW